MTLLNFLPAWMEILVNVIGYAGFIGIATWHANFARWNARSGLHSCTSLSSSLVTLLTAHLPLGSSA